MSIGEVWTHSPFVCWSGFHATVNIRVTEVFTPTLKIIQAFTSYLPIFCPKLATGNPPNVISKFCSVKVSSVVPEARIV